MPFVTLMVMTMLCLIFPTTRVHAIIGIGLLLFLYPLASIGVLLSAVVAYYFQEKFI